MQRLLTLPFVLAILGAVAAQVPTSNLPSAPPGEQILAWPTNLGTGQLRKATGMFWNNVDQLAAIAVRGNTTGRAMAPGMTPFIKPFDVQAPVFDFVTLPQAGLLGPQSRDALLLSVIGGSELRFVRTIANGEMVITQIAHPGWQRASAMTARPDSTGIDIVARSTTNTGLLRTRYSYLLGTFTQVPSITVAQPILDLCIVDFNRDSVNDVAVLTAAELRIYDLGGTTLFSLPCSGGAIEATPDASRPDALTLLRRNANNAGWELVHINGSMSGGVTIAAAVSVAINGNDFALGGMTAGDMDNDGRWDLAIQDTGTKVQLVRNIGGASPFAGPLSVPITVGTFGGNQAPASMGDYDYDGTADLLVPLTAADGKSYLVLEKGLRGRVAAPQDFTDLFSDIYYEASSELRMQLNLDDYLRTFSSVVVTFYTATQSELDGGGYARQVGPQVVFNNQAANGTLTTTLSSGIVDPSRLFFRVQFSSPTNTKQKPTFLGGASAQSGPTPLTGAFLNGQLPTGGIKKPLHRNPGRVVIGIYASQTYLPLDE